MKRRKQRKQNLWLGFALHGHYLSLRLGKDSKQERERERERETTSSLVETEREREIWK